MNRKEIDQKQLEEILIRVCDKETSLDPDNWEEENPLWGHCAVVALLAQDFWNGDLLRASLSEVKGFEHMRSHYWNKLEDGNEVDFTRNQFGNKYPENLKSEIREREYVLSYPETAKRYELLKARVFELLEK